ncbi:MAG: hypothetical protein M1833_006087 [Piccolia ochrophora]|nr:MAG: hypothetical protein M1833_006087 [Piccolia ochrophora]
MRTLTFFFTAVGAFHPVSCAFLPGFSTDDATPSALSTLASREETPDPKNLEDLHLDCGKFRCSPGVECDGDKLYEYNEMGMGSCLEVPDVKLALEMYKIEGKTTSTTCALSTPEGKPDPWGRGPEPGFQTAAARCYINEPFGLEILDAVFDGFEAIKENEDIMKLMNVCKVFNDIAMTSFDVLGYVGLPTPGLGALALSAKGIAAAATSLKGGVQAFKTSLTKVGGSKTPKDLDYEKMYKYFKDYPTEKLPKPKGGKPAEPKKPAKPTKPKSKDGKSTKTTEDNTKTTKTTEDNTKTTKTTDDNTKTTKTTDDNTKTTKTTDDNTKTTDACRVKRGPGEGKGKGKENCGPTITKIRSATSTGVKKITRRCDWEDGQGADRNSVYPQACLHYASVLENYAWAREGMLCPDSAGRKKGVKGLVATDAWGKQHVNAWTALVKDKHSCERDEFPPAEFMKSRQFSYQDLFKKGSKVLSPDPESIGQLVRYIPADDNKGAAKIWGTFCSDEDHGIGNSLCAKIKGKGKGKALSDEFCEELNQEEYDDEGDSGDSDSGKGKGKGKANPKGKKKAVSPREKVGSEVKGGTTTETWDVNFARASMAFKFQDTYKGKKPADQDWGLKDNPCWPNENTEDPGFALLLEDKYYDKSPLKREEARKRYASNPGKRPAPPDRGPSGAQPPPKGGKPNQKRDIQILDDGLAVRDVNHTRRFTDEEWEEPVEVIKCKDHDCSAERRALEEEGEDGYLVIPGQSPPAKPAANADAAPSPGFQTIYARDEPSERNAVAPEMPAETGGFD